MCFKNKFLLLSLFSLNGFSGTMGPAQAIVHSWDIGGRALYLQPTSDAGTRPEVTITSNTNNQLTVGTEPAWGWGFQLEGAYHISESRDINLNWHHYSHTNSNTSEAGSGQDLNVGDLVSSINPLLNTFTTPGIYSSASVFWDQVNVEFARTTERFENTIARFHGGVNFSRARIGGDSQGSWSVQNAGSALTENYNIYYLSSESFNGFGPRLGANLSYQFLDGFSVGADGAISVLAGSSKTSIYRQVYSQLLNTIYASNSGANHSHVVGELDANLEARYTKSLSYGDLSANVGWLFANYMNAFSLQRNDENSFGIQGLYFGLKWLS